VQTARLPPAEAGHKTGDTWLLITSKTRPMVFDQ
jgi:hypothetical protein